MRLGLRGRIFLLVLVALVPPTAIALAVAVGERDEARRHAQFDILGSTRLAAADVKSVIDSTESFLSAVAQDLSDRPARAHCERLLTLVTRATDRYSSLGVASPDGTVPCGATAGGALPPRRPADVSRTSWFRGARERGGFTLGGLGAGPLTGERALLSSFPVRTGPGESPRVLFAGLDLEELSAASGLEEAPRGITLNVLDDRGRVVARVPRDAGVVGRRLPQRPLVETVLERRQGTAELRGLDGVQRIYGFAPVGGSAGERLFVTAGRRSASVYADPAADLRRYLLLAALGLLAALALSYLAMRLLLMRWADAVVGAARRLGQGDLTARADVPGGLGELSDVADALNTAAADIERRQHEHASLLAELVAAEEETRRRVAADIHDDTAQAVAAAGLRMDALTADLKDPTARATARNARTALVEANRRLRRLLFELRPPALDEAGIGAALELFLSDSFAHDGCDWRVENLLDREPSPEVRAIMYRVALEALTNVRKHARARQVEVLLERRGPGYAVRIRDDGEGFDPPEPETPVQPGHIGIVSMRERAQAAGGRLAVSSTPGAGTVVDFWMPGG